MARLPRLEWPGQTHYLLQRGHAALASRGVFADAQDRAAFLAALREAAASEEVQVHAYALLATEVHMLVTPVHPGALGRMVQAVGRRYVSAYNRRYQHRGSLWDGRFRSAVVEPGPTRLAALLLVDGLSAEGGVTSAGHHSGALRDPLLNDTPEIWALGNTPFDREATYRKLLALGPLPAQADALRQAVSGGWVAGSARYAAAATEATSRPAQPRPRGRPRAST